MVVLFSWGNIVVAIALFILFCVVLSASLQKKSPYLFDTFDEWQAWINQASYQELMAKRAELLDDSRKRPSAYKQIVQLIDVKLLDDKRVPLNTDNALIVDDVNDFIEQIMNVQMQTVFSGFCCLPYDFPKIVIARIQQDEKYGQLLGVQIADDLLICPPKISLDYKADEALHFAKFNHRQLLNAADVGRLKKLAGNVARTFRCVDIDFDEKAMFWGLAESDDLSLSEKDLLVAYALYSGHDCTNVKLDEKRALICKI